MTKVSVVMPSLNVVKYIRQCIESVINQTLKDIEIICVDAGSTDGTLEILEEYAQKDSRIRIIQSDKKSYGYQMNLGLERAKGKYFAVVETDDMIMRDAFEILYRNAEEFEADIVRSDYYDMKTVNGKTKLIAKQMSQDYEDYYRLIYPNKEQRVYTFVMHNWTGLYRMKFLQDKNIRYNESPGASYQDNGFYFQVFSQTERLVYIPEPFYCYRIDNPGSSINDNTKVYTMTEEYQFIHEFLQQHEEFYHELMPVFYARLFRGYHQTFMRIAPKYRNAYVQYMHEQFKYVLENGYFNAELYSQRQRYLMALLVRSPIEYMSAALQKKNKRISRATLKYGIWMLRQDPQQAIIKAKKVLKR